MASSSQSTPYGSLLPGALSLEPYRDPTGFLPLVPCHKCGTIFIGRMSQKSGSKGKRFYKCPLLEHTELKCGVYMFEEQYVEYLVKRGYLPLGCSRIRGQDLMALEFEQAGNETVKAGDRMEVQQAVKLVLAAQTKVEKIGERLLVVCVAKLFVLVLVLLVMLVK